MGVHAGRLDKVHLIGNLTGCAVLGHHVVGVAHLVLALSSRTDLHIGALGPAAGNRLRVDGRRVVNFDGIAFHRGGRIQIDVITVDRQIGQRSIGALLGLLERHGIRRPLRAVFSRDHVKDTRVSVTVGLGRLCDGNTVSPRAADSGKINSGQIGNFDEVTFHGGRLCQIHVVATGSQRGDSSIRARRAGERDIICVAGVIIILDDKVRLAVRPLDTEIHVPAAGPNIMGINGIQVVHYVCRVANAHSAVINSPGTNRDAVNTAGLRLHGGGVLCNRVIGNSGRRRHSNKRGDSCRAGNCLLHKTHLGILKFALVFPKQTPSIAWLLPAPLLTRNQQRKIYPPPTADNSTPVPSAWPVSQNRSRPQRTHP